MGDKKKELVEYTDRKCFLCEKVFVLSYFVSTRNKEFFICPHCAKDLKETLQAVVV